MDKQYTQLINHIQAQLDASESLYLGLIDIHENATKAKLAQASCIDIQKVFTDNGLDVQAVIAKFTPMEWVLVVPNYWVLSEDIAAIVKYAALCKEAYIIANGLRLPTGDLVYGILSPLDLLKSEVN